MPTPIITSPHSQIITSKFHADSAAIIAAPCQCRWMTPQATGPALSGPGRVILAVAERNLMPSIPLSSFTESFLASVAAGTGRYRGGADPVRALGKKAGGGMRWQRYLNSDLELPGQNSKLAVLIGQKLYCAAGCAGEGDLRQMLEESELRLRAVIEASDEAVIGVDSEGRILFCNRRAALVFGYPEKELVNLSSTRLVPRRFRRKYDEMLKRAFTLTNSQAPGNKIRVFGLKKSGRTFPIELTLRFLESNGHFCGLGVIHDLSGPTLIESELEQFFKLSVDMLCIAGTDGYFKTINPAFERELGIPADDLLAAPFIAFVHPYDIENTLQEIQKLSETVQTVRFTNRYRCKNNSYKWLAWTFQRNDDLLYGVAHNITDQKNAEENLRRMMLFAELNPAPVLRFDAEGIILMANPAARKIFGISNDERALLSSVLPAVQKFDLAACIQQQEKLTLSTQIGDRFYQFTLYGLPELNFAHLYGTDITERVEAEEEIRRSHRETEEILATISSILIGVDEHDHITQWNSSAEHFFGITAKNVIGLPFENCGIQWDWQVVAERVKTSRRLNCPLRKENMNYLRPDGIQGILSLTISPIRTDKTKAAGYLILATEETERRNLELQLRQAQKLESIGQLAAGIAHEINTPIQYVNDNAHFLQEAFDDIGKLLTAYSSLLTTVNSGQPVEQQLKDITALTAEIELDYLLEEIPLAIQHSQEGSNRVAHIVRAMKEFSHPELEEKSLVDINHAIRNTVTVASNEWKYVADVEMDFDMELPTVPCIVGELNQVILNIIINAAHAIGDIVGRNEDQKGTITISTRSFGSVVEIRVDDTGPGIPDKIQSKIFDPFFTTKEVGKGTGQGLAISRNVIVNKHQGELTFETREGKGTTFIIRLPLETMS